MSDFRALLHFIDLVTEVAQPLNQCSEEYLSSIINRQLFNELSSEVWRAYRAVEDEIAFSIHSLVDKKEQIEYLDMAKAILDETPAFKSMFIEGTEFVSQRLLKLDSQLSTTELALHNMDQFIAVAWDRDLETGENRGTGKLTFGERQFITFLHFYATKAYECWIRIEDAIARFMRLANFPVVNIASPKAKKHNSKRFDLSTFPSRVGMKSTMVETIDYVLEKMEVVVKKSKGVYEPTESGIEGHPYIAVMRLLIHNQKAHKLSR